MRVFYDTNVLLSTLLWRGEVYRTHRDLIERGLVPVASERVVGEALAVVRRKFPSLDAGEIERAIRAVWEVVPSTDGRSSEAVRDPDDEAVLADAEAAGVVALLTGDRDLLDVAERVTTLRVVSVRELRERYL